MTCWLLLEFKSARSLLTDIETLSEAKFIADPHKISSAKYNFIVTIGSIIDIYNHLISKNGFRVPEDYADTFKVMAENRLLPMKFTESLIKMARFRNRLLHLYWEVNACKNLGSGLNNFLIYCHSGIIPEVHFS